MDADAATHWNEVIDRRSCEIEEGKVTCRPVEVVRDIRTRLQAEAVGYSLSPLGGWGRAATDFQTASYNSRRVHEELVEAEVPDQPDAHGEALAGVARNHVFAQASVETEGAGGQQRQVHRRLPAVGGQVKDGVLEHERREGRGEQEAPGAIEPGIAGGLEHEEPVRQEGPGHRRRNGDEVRRDALPMFRAPREQIEDGEVHGRRDEPHHDEAYNLFRSEHQESNR